MASRARRQEADLRVKGLIEEPSSSEVLDTVSVFNRGCRLLLRWTRCCRLEPLLFSAPLTSS